MFILEELLAGNGRNLKVDLLITLGTPHAGRKLLNPLHRLRKLPGLRRFGQLSQLAARSETIRFVKENWNDQRILRQPGNSTSKRRYIRSVAVVGAYDIWAGRSTEAEGSDIDVRRYLEKSHPALAKPRSETEALSELIVGELSQHRRPDAALREITEIRGDQEKMRQFILRNSESVAQIMNRNRPGLPREGIQTKTATIMVDFLYDCPRRPMRCLTLDQMLQLYTERMTGDWV